MATKRERILAALKTNLANTVGVGTRIYRSRPEAFVKAETPAIVLEPISDTPQDTTSFNNSITWEFRIRISVIIRGLYFYPYFLRPTKLMLKVKVGDDPPIVCTILM